MCSPRRHLLSVALTLCAVCSVSDMSRAQTYCNPVNINYRFRVDGGLPFREAADPNVIRFRGDYYLFASKSGGYWWSPDMQGWQFVPITDELDIEGYAPAVMIYEDELYYMASETAMYKSSDPKAAKWEQVTDWKIGYDPAFLLDDDGKVFLYWGCDQMGPIEGVELDPTKNFDRIGDSFVCFRGNPGAHGWERRPDGNPWIEGAWMTKHEGQYYLQYAAPGTEFDCYADGLYVGRTPKGPFIYQPYSPISSKRYGFINGAGHGCTFEDEYGNLWRALTQSISIRHPFERRIAIFPADIDDDGVMYTATAYGDYPHFLPDGKRFPGDAFTGWMLLSYGKAARASSHVEGYEPDKAVDENIRTYWTASENGGGEWFEVDLGSEMTIRAVQINHAEYPEEVMPVGAAVPKYEVAISLDGEEYEQVAVREGLPHDYVELDQKTRGRYVRVQIMGGGATEHHFSLRGLRVFGKADGVEPDRPRGVRVQRGEDQRDAEIAWKPVDGAEGYVVHMGVEKEKLYISYMVRGQSQLTVTDLNRGVECYAAVEAFSPSGRSKKSKPVKL